MLRGLAEKFAGNPARLEKAVRNVAKVATELAPMPKQLSVKQQQQHEQPGSGGGEGGKDKGVRRRGKGKRR